MLKLILLHSRIVLDRVYWLMISKNDMAYYRWTGNKCQANKSVKDELTNLIMVLGLVGSGRKMAKENRWRCSQRHMYLDDMLDKIRNDFGLTGLDFNIWELIQTFI